MFVIIVINLYFIIIVMFSQDLFLCYELYGQSQKRALCACYVWRCARHRVCQSGIIWMCILASYSMPQENVLQVLVPFCPSRKLYSRLKFPYVKFCGMCPMLLKMRVPKRKDRLNLRFLIENSSLRMHLQALE